MNKNLPHIFICYIKDKDEIKEKVYFKTKIPDNLLLESDVIIDILNGTIVKSRFNIDNEEKFISEYMTKYSNQVTETVKLFFAKNRDIWNNLTKNIENLLDNKDIN